MHQTVGNRRKERVRKSPDTCNRLIEFNMVINDCYFCICISKNMYQKVCTAFKYIHKTVTSVPNDIY